METKVLTSSSSIFYLLTYFLFHETLVNKYIQVIETSGRGYIVGILIQLTIYGFAWFTAFKYMFLFNLRHYKCFYCKSNLRNGFLMPDLYEKVVLFVFLCYLVQKLWNLLTFAIRIWRNKVPLIIHKTTSPPLWSTPKSVFCKAILYINIDKTHF